ncbi:YkvA family protein [Flammeovirga pacifica]|uniref:DUF1232 domain-containing protein n=1 Tax=Flammeovirga pacifica TaxID=915059 RepID=A0A1S1YX54_FLAPC|nr:YkvA family protein [Flammeovirga pacifica]OHX65602.1 hypothetical protein NH26_04185 [Flammeovirga pacifica]
MNKTEILKITGEQLIKFSQVFKEAKFWRKLMKYGKKAGFKLSFYAVTLFYTMLDEDTPNSSKLVIMGALGYFIMPIDLIPDIAPGIGFTDDLAALSSAFFTVALHIKPKHKEDAFLIMKKIFGNDLQISQLEF